MLVRHVSRYLQQCEQPGVWHLAPQHAPTSLVRCVPGTMATTGANTSHSWFDILQGGLYHGVSMATSHGPGSPLGCRHVPDDDLLCAQEQVNNGSKEEPSSLAGFLRSLGRAGDLSWQSIVQFPSGRSFGEEMANMLAGTISCPSHSPRRSRSTLPVFSPAYEDKQLHRAHV